MENFLIGGIIISAVLLYLLMPKLLVFIAAHSKGKKGLVFLGALSAVTIPVYFLFGYRNMELLKIALLILFTAAMIWLYFNYRSIDVLVSSQYGQVIATIVFLLIIVLIGVFSWLLI